MDRFWFKVDVQDDSVCWEWLAAKQEGYGVVGYNRKVWFAHRLAWVFTHEKDIPDGMVIRHTCDNPSCVNPAHLVLGTQQENCMDIIDRNRRVYVKGTDHHKSNLTEQEVSDIRSSTEPTKILSQKYDLHRSTIKRIRNFTSYR